MATATTIPTARLAEIVAQLDAYTGDDIWGELIMNLPEYDDDRTAALDTSGAIGPVSDELYDNPDRINTWHSEFVLADGTQIRHDAQDGSFFWTR